MELINKKTGFKYRPYHFRAIELRYNGHTYREIYEILNREASEIKEEGTDKIVASEPTIRGWFARNGILEEMYLDYCDKENDRRQKFMRSELKNVLRHFPEKFEALLTKRFAYSMMGEQITDERGEKVEKLDIVTVQTLKLLIEIFGITMSDKGGESVLDKFFDRVEDEVEKEEKDEVIAPHENSTGV